LNLNEQKNLSEHINLKKRPKEILLICFCSSGANIENMKGPAKLRV